MWHPLLSVVVLVGLQRHDHGTDFLSRAKDHTSKSAVLLDPLRLGADGRVLS